MLLYWTKKSVHYVGLVVISLKTWIRSAFHISLPMPRIAHAGSGLTLLCSERNLNGNTDLWDAACRWWSIFRFQPRIVCKNHELRNMQVIDVLNARYNLPNWWLFFVLLLIRCVYALNKFVPLKICLDLGRTNCRIIIPIACPRSRDQILDCIFKHRSLKLNS